MCELSKLRKEKNHEHMNTDHRTGYLSNDVVINLIIENIEEDFNMNDLGISNIELRNQNDSITGEKRGRLGSRASNPVFKKQNKNNMKSMNEKSHE